MKRWRRLGRLAPQFLAASVRRDWPLAALALVSLAPGVAALVAWMQIAWRVRGETLTAAQFGWVLPAALLEAVTPAGVLLGSGLVTLLVGCLGLSNAYLASVERRLGGLALLLALGLSRWELMALLLLEAMGLALLGTVAGLVLGFFLSVAVWLPARGYLLLEPGFTLYWPPFVIGAIAGLLATLLFVGITGISTALRSPMSALRSRSPRHWIRDWGHWRFSTLGVLFTAVLVTLLGVLVLGLRSGLILTGLALVLAAALNFGSLLLTRFYWRLPTPEGAPLWALAVQGLARHRRQTAGMTLAMIAGTLGVGLAALSWMNRRAEATFPLWVAAMLLVACATLVLTSAALAALERRQELGLLAALGARRGRVRRLILLENGIVALAGGALGAALALLAWALVGVGVSSDDWPLAIAIAVIDVLAALATATVGAAPVLWLISRQPPGLSLRDRPWLAP
ncbi:MAG TPA: FtsX-like permease family protein [Anaerolineae bacterium]|nr:FtsX-like permease family protein [Anaerolineae bacterium]